MMDNSAARHGERRPIFQWLRRDFWRKVIALAFALLLYFNVTMRIGGDEKVSGVPVELDLPGDMVCLDTLPRVEVTISGSKKTLEGINSSKLRVRGVVESSEYIPGSPYRLRLLPEQVKVPPGVRAVAVEPRDVTLNLDRIVSRKVEPKASFKGALASEFQVSSVRFNPPEVTVTGPESLVRSITTCRTTDIPLDGDVVNSFDYTVTMRPQELVQVSPQRVNASVDIRRGLGEQLYRRIPVLLMRSPQARSHSGFEVSLLDDASVDVLLAGPAGKVAIFPRSGIQCGVDVSHLDAPGTYTLDVGCFLNGGENILVKSVNPAKIRVKVSGKIKK